MRVYKINMNVPTEPITWTDISETFRVKRGEKLIITFSSFNFISAAFMYVECLFTGYG